MRVLLRLGASPSLPFCFEVDPSDEPLRPEHPRLNAGIAAHTALQLSRHRGTVDIRELLEDAGASDASDSPRERCDDECPVCMETLGEGACETTLCGHVFHAACLPPMVRKCPLCRTPLRRSQVPQAHAAALPDAARRYLDTRGSTITEPPYLQSPTWLPALERVYTQLERRRM